MNQQRTSIASAPKRIRPIFPLPIGLLALTVVGGCAGETRVPGDEDSPQRDTAAQVAGAPVWTYCAKEAQICHFEGTRTVRYGENGVFVEKEVTAQGGGVWCINNVFGDPIAVEKHCDILESGSAHTTPMPGDGSTREPIGPSVEGAQSWSDPATWGGRIPAAGEAISIPAGRTILLDADTPSLGQLTIHGTLIFDRRDVSLTASGIVLHGTLAIGSSAQPFTQRATITLTGGVSDDQASRGLVSMGGSLLLYGDTNGKNWTTLDDHANASTNKLTLASDVSFHAGDRLVVAPTDFYDVMPTEQVTASEVSGRSITLSTPLQHTHWGKLQYLTPTGMSLTPGAQVDLPAPGVPTTVDERAEVASLTRNIVIQGADDAAWQQSGFGAHVMVMEQSSQTSINGVELRRVGQSGRQARYPIHFHQLSYSGGQEIPAGGSRVVRNSAIWGSANRCITIHGSNDVTLDGNVCFDIEGHAIFLEDAVERRNTITNNLVLKVRVPRRPLLESDKDGYERGVSAFWLTNPDNVVRGNHAADTPGVGFWLAYPASPLGANKQVPIHPQYMPLGVFSDNTAHSTGQFNINLDWAPYDDAGNTGNLAYTPTDDSQPHERSEHRNVRFKLDRMASWKGRGIWNRPVGADITEWTSADNYQMFFQGSGYMGRIRRVLAVGETLNNATSWKEVAPGMPPTAFASYHGEYNMQDNVVVNFPLVPGPERQANGGSQTSHGGMLETKDYYTHPVDLSPVYIRNNLLINTHPGFRVAKPDKAGAHWTLAGALGDPHGLWGPKDNYWVYDMPFLTTGTTCQSVDPAGSNGKSCAGPYYGMHTWNGNASELKINDRFVRRIDVRREDDAGREIGTWTVRDGRTGDGFFDIMRHVALVKGGRYTFEMSDETSGSQQRYVPRGDVSFQLTNFKRPDDEVLVGIPFSGGETARAFVSSYHTPDWAIDNPAKQINLRSVGSLAEVQQGNGDRMWYDGGNQRMWIKVRSPAVRNDPAFDPELTDLAVLHIGTWVRIFTCPFVSDKPRSPNDPAVTACQGK